MAEDNSSKRELTMLGPWAFWRQAIPSWHTHWTWQWGAAWLGLFLGTSLAWARHLYGLAGWSGISTYWGESLTGRDLWEMTVNGGGAQHPVDVWTVLCGVLFLPWALWAGWGVQESAQRRKPHLMPWLKGLLDAVFVAVLPLWLFTWLMASGLSALAKTGIPWLAWLNFLGTPLLKMWSVALGLLCWWVCRAWRVEILSLQPAQPYWKSLLNAMGNLGMHAGAWLGLVTGALTLRVGLHLLALSSAWHLGGGTPMRILFIYFAQLCVVALSAGITAWLLRLVSYHVHHAAQVRQEVLALEAQQTSGTVPL